MFHKIFIVLKVLLSFPILIGIIISVYLSKNKQLILEDLSRYGKKNNYKSFWCAEKVQRTMLQFELDHHRKPKVAMMGLAFKPNIDDLRESPAKYIITKVMQSCNNTDIMVVEPNITSHNVFKLTDYRDAYDRADIVVMLVAHDPFKTLPWRDDKIILDFCGIYR